MKTVVKLVVLMVGLGFLAAVAGAEGVSLAGEFGFKDEKGDFGMIQLNGKGGEMRAVKPGHFEAYPEVGRPDPEHFRAGARVPITELRLVNRPGELHYVDDGHGGLRLSDWWYEEYIVGYRNLLERHSEAPPLPPPHPEHGRPVAVEMKADSLLGHYEGSFKIAEGETREVELTSHLGRKVLTAHFDGRNLDLGFKRAASMDPRLRGQWQRLGSREGLKDLKVMITWRDEEWGHDHDHDSIPVVPPPPPHPHHSHH